jgi:hypothetical protein
MIRVKTTIKELKKGIIAAAPDWYDKAEELVEGLREATRSGEKLEFPSHWGKIKQVYIDLQHSKCGFCEKPLEGKIEQDVEHYRPKGKVTAWKAPRPLAKVIADEGLGVVQPADGSDEPGYALLAYHPGNYLMACKNCNSILKKNFFPVAGKRDSAGTNPARMKAEKPYLIYPIGDGDEDPESLIRYDGLSPQPVARTGFGRLRALVTIEVFKLDDWRTRKMLLRGRAHLIRELYLALRAVATESDSATVKKRKVLVDELLKADNPFTNCMRCFHRLYRDDPAEAGRVFDSISRLLKKSSG